MKAQVFEKKAASILTPTCGFLGPSYTHSISPYSGCQFKCRFCYVQSLTIQRTNRHKLGWQEWVDVKVNAAELLGKEARKGKLERARVYLSPVTDPFMPAEAKYCVTQGCLKVMREYPPDYLTIQTHAVLVARDMEIIKGIPRCQVNISITTNDESVKRVFEPNLPSVMRRVEAAARLKSAGITTVITVSPLLPCQPLEFARLLDPVCDFVVMDYFFDGDGARGARSQRMLAQLRELGYPEWAVPGYQGETISVFQEVMGRGRVLISQDGFNNLINLNR